MNQLINAIEQNETIAITGHIRPDGDCIGSCLGLYHFIKKNYQAKTVDVYLEPFNDEYLFLKDADLIQTKIDEQRKYDLFVVLDCGSVDRILPFIKGFEQAKETICIDHHISNSGFGDHYIIKPDASSTCELLYDLLESKQIDLDTATCLYTGIVHDTGVFKHSNTTRHTMEVAGKLLELGVNNSYIIDETFYAKTYLQNQILGRALLESILFLDGQVIFSYLSQKMLDIYEVTGKDLDGVIDQLRVTRGVEVAILIYDLAGEYDGRKVSMRSNNFVDVSTIAKEFGGGGHIRAAGCNMKGNIYDIIQNIGARIETQLIQEGKK